MLGAWSPDYSSLIEVLPFQRLGVLWTSSAGEMGFESYEQQALKAIMEDDRISFVWFGDKSLARLFPEKGFWAPYPFDIPDPLPEVLPKSDIMTLFCPDTAKKNMFNQLVAAVFLQRKLGFLTLETNIQVPEVIRSELRCRQRGWLPEDKYKSILSSSKLNLACSWAETFNYQAAEAALLGVPSVGSPAIPWLPRQNIVENPNDPEEIARVAEAVLEKNWLSLRAHLVHYALAANNQLRESLSRL